MNDKDGQFSDSLGFDQDSDVTFEYLMSSSSTEKEYHTPCQKFENNKVNWFLTAGKKNRLNSVNSRKKKPRKPSLKEEDSGQASNSFINTWNESCSTLRDSSDILFVSFPTDEEEASAEIPGDKKMTGNDDTTSADFAEHYSESSKEKREEVHAVTHTVSEQGETGIELEMKEIQRSNFTSVSSVCIASNGFSNSSEFKSKNFQKNYRKHLPLTTPETINVDCKNKLRNIMTVSSNVSEQQTLKDPCSRVENMIGLTYFGDNKSKTKTTSNHYSLPASKIEQSSMTMIPVKETEPLSSFMSLVMNPKISKSSSLELQYLSQWNDTPVPLVQDDTNNFQSLAWNPTEPATNHDSEKTIAVKTKSFVGHKSFSGEILETESNFSDYQKVISKNLSIVNVAQNVNSEKDETFYDDDEHISKPTSMEPDFEDTSDVKCAYDIDAECLLIVSSDSSLDEYSNTDQGFETKDLRKTTMHCSMKRVDHLEQNCSQSYFDKDPVLLEYVNFNTEEKGALIVYLTEHVQKMKSQEKKPISKKEIKEKLIRNSKIRSGKSLGIIFGLEKNPLLKKKLHEKVLHSTPKCKHTHKECILDEKADRTCNLSDKSQEGKISSSTFIKSPSATKLISRNDGAEGDFGNQVKRSQKGAVKIQQSSKNRQKTASEGKTSFQKHVFPISRRVERTPETSSLLARKRVSAERVISPEFLALFRYYAKLGNRLKSGYVISKGNSNFWLKRSGIIEDEESASIADHCFSEIAGKKLVLNIHDYVQYLAAICKRRKVILIDLVEQLTKTATPDFLQSKKTPQQDSLIPVNAAEDYHSSATLGQSPKLKSAPSSKIPVFSPIASKQ